MFISKQSLELESTRVWENKHEIFYYAIDQSNSRLGYEGMREET